MRETVGKRERGREGGREGQGGRTRAEGSDYCCNVAFLTRKWTQYLTVNCGNNDLSILPKRAE